MTARRGALLGVGLSLLALTVVRGGGGGPPLYDGICLPPHYLAFGSTPPPPSRSQTFTASDLSSSFQLADNDTTPQAQIIVGSGSLAPAPGSSAVTLSIAAVAPPTTKPTGGVLDGNVYSFDARSGGQEVSLAAGHPATIVLGATSTGSSQLSLEHFDGTRWTAAGKTFQSGCGTTYEAASQVLGLFALVSPSGASGGGTAQGGAPIVLIIVVVVVVLVLIFGAVRLSRRRR